ncbi:MAG: hypothetical protein AABY07_03530 [Nanoarchaeota archaeon]
MAEETRKKKRWYPILASNEFNNIQVGETVASEANNLIGRTVIVNLMVLTNDPKKQSYNVVFKVKNVSNDSGITELIKYYMNIAHTKRLVRKGISKVEDSFVVKTKDNVQYKIKPFIIVRFKAQKSYLTGIRMKAREHITNLFNDLESKDVFLTVVSNKLQMDLKSILKKIYPVNVCEIRILEKL